MTSNYTIRGCGPGPPTPPSCSTGTSASDGASSAATYERAGFERDRKIGKHRWVVVKDVPASR